MSNETIDIFEEVREFPDPAAARRFASLIGLDQMKERLLKEARLIFDPGSLTEWSNEHHHQRIRLIEFFRDRPPLFIFAGDVGTGKTALAETFGDAVARNAEVPITLYALSLNSRGTGAVGEMTGLLSRAFGEVKQAAKMAAGRRGKKAAGVVLLIDEADALAQSRELAQMHHEDRAGVNALIRGIDGLATGNLPAIVVMCTNRLDALDPAIRRRAAVTFTFARPDEGQRHAFLKPVLEELGFNSQQVHSLVAATGATHGRAYGYTYSDLAQRLLPGLLLAAYPSKPITFDLAKEVVERHPPTPPFQSEAL
ncbi:MAG: AAA family ATPase [Bryobacteraceae bacterium]|nr:AAA family ATPase [Bryobacteraceae bacterium]